MSDDMVTLRAPEVRTFPALEFREVDGTESGRFLEGRAVPYNRWADIGWFRERFVPGAFSKSIREAAKALPLLLWHDNRSFPIGVTHEWRDNDAGLDVVWRLDVEDPRAVEAARKAREGMLTGLSIGFAPIEKRGKNARGELVDLNNEVELDDLGVMSITRREARLLEVSMTPTPAYAGAKVSLVRSRAPQSGQRRRSAEVEAWRRYLADVTR
jgi:HK97 family phage prohead protease